MKIKLILLWLGYGFCLNLSAQNIEILTTGTKTSLRGLSVVDDRTVWVSGSAGTVGKSSDGGKTWQWMNVPGYEKTDFRDIEAFDAQTALIMGVASPAYILKTSDGGQSWRKVYENRDSSMFLDAMDFFDARNGIVIGDPLQDRVFLAKTTDAGETWQEIPQADRPKVEPGEAFFASSGTNVRLLSPSHYVMASGGKKSHLFAPGLKSELPLVQGKEMTGANSVALKGSKLLIVVGGDYTAKDSTLGICALSRKGEGSFSLPKIGPHGYRSCVEYLGKKNWITCGLNGIDWSSDDGQTWKWISKEGFHVCRKAKQGTAVYFAGGGGKIGKLSE
jgi:photosystem II stability/assembly factor-like uncharacterized protein